MPIPLIALNGPTASGKSSLAVDVALALAGSGLEAEVINADSMLVYRGMDIGTAKPTIAQRRGIRHHLIDIWPVTRHASVAEFQTLARETIDEVRSRGVIGILVGGSALYMRAILDEFEFPGADAQVRARWEDELAKVGAHALHAELARRSPDAAAGILPGNGRRVVRALEVLELTGAFVPRLPHLTYAVEGVVSWGLELDRDLMDARITARVDDMWDAGLVDEVRSLEPELRSGLTASRALGYRQVLAMLAGDITEDEARQQSILGTKRFARKQLGWFRRDERITWLSATSQANASIIAAGTLGACGSGTSPKVTPR